MFKGNLLTAKLTLNKSNQDIDGHKHVLFVTINIILNLYFLVILCIKTNAFA